LRASFARNKSSVNNVLALHRKRLTMHKSIQESLSSLRSRGGHGFPAFNAARLASRIATIFFACERVSSRRLARPPRRPISARYSCIFFSVAAISASNIHHKLLMMYAEFYRNVRQNCAGRGRRSPRLATGRVRPIGGPKMSWIFVRNEHSFSPMAKDTVLGNGGSVIAGGDNQFAPAQVLERGLHGAFGKSGRFREHA